MHICCIDLYYTLTKLRQHGNIQRKIVHITDPNFSEVAASKTGSHAIVRPNHDSSRFLRLRMGCVGQRRRFTRLCFSYRFLLWLYYLFLLWLY